MTSKSLIEIYLETKDSITLIKKTILPTIMSSYNAEIDLFSYINNFRFSVSLETTNTENEDIYSLEIFNHYYSNYSKIYNFQEKNISKILGYHNQMENKIILLYQTETNINYFIIEPMNDTLYEVNLDK